MGPLRLAIIVPVYNDWDSLEILIPKIDFSLRDKNVKAKLIIINDASTDKARINTSAIEQIHVVDKIDIVHLNCNTGHQRAIAIGLSEAYRRDDLDAIVVMDSDGEDRPEDIPNLLAEHIKQKEAIIVAGRKKRSEDQLFKLGYLAYRLIFRILTGCSINFGNFCLIPANKLRQLVYRDSLCNHLPATILRAKNQVVMISTTRGSRLIGKTNMNLPTLVLQGFSAVSVYSDIALLRIIFMSIVFGVISVVGIVTVTIMKFFTQLATPSWASTVVGSLTTIIVLLIFMYLLILLLILSNRSQLTIIPAKHLFNYIHNIQTVFKK